MSLRLLTSYMFCCLFVISSFRYFVFSLLRYFVFSHGVISSFRMAPFRREKKKRRHAKRRQGAKISSFRVGGFVFSSFRMPLFRLFVFSHCMFSSFSFFSPGVFSSYRVALRKDEMAQSSHHRILDDGPEDCIYSVVFFIFSFPPCLWPPTHT